MTPTARKLNARAEMADDDGDYTRAEGFADDARAVRRIENEALHKVIANVRSVTLNAADPGVALEEIARIATEAIAKIRND